MILLGSVLRFVVENPQIVSEFQIIVRSRISERMMMTMVSTEIMDTYN